MKHLFLFLSFAFIVAGNFSLEKYKHTFNAFCSGANKKVCTKELFEYGMNYLQNQFIELENKIIHRRKMLRIAARNRRLEQMRRQKFQHTLRMHFLDRHL